MEKVVLLLVAGLLAPSVDAQKPTAEEVSRPAIEVDIAAGNEASAPGAHSAVSAHTAPTCTDRQRGTSKTSPELAATSIRGEGSPLDAPQVWTPLDHVACD